MNSVFDKAVFSIDLEDWYQGIELPYADWGKYEKRIEKGFYAIFNLLEKYQTKATWFTLGWVADHYPQLIKKSCIRQDMNWARIRTSMKRFMTKLLHNFVKK
ncbi:MAG: hypothetical protein IPO27_02360 [Bacteroidetes bacterium]|nr:hypothetical protein [Bacteroidota bacterium]